MNKLRPWRCQTSTNRQYWSDGRTFSRTVLLIAMLETGKVSRWPEQFGLPSSKVNERKMLGEVSSKPHCPSFEVHFPKVPDFSQLHIALAFLKAPPTTAASVHDISHYSVTLQRNSAILLPFHLKKRITNLSKIWSIFTFVDSAREEVGSFRKKGVDPTSDRDQLRTII